MLAHLKRTILPAVLLLTAGACGDGGSGARESSEAFAGTDAAVAEEAIMTADVRRAAQAPREPQDAVARPRMLIRTGSATVEVEDVDAAVESVRAIVEGAGGFLSNVALSAGRDHVRSATLTMRIPAERFDETLAGLDALGTVESVHIGSEDVGEQYADLEVRIANARRLEQRLLELLSTRTGSLEDVLAVERELARVRVEIERMDAQMRSMRDRVALSTLSVTLHEPEPLFSSGRGENVITRSIRQAGRNFVGFVGGFIASLGVLLPLAVLVGLLWTAWRVWRRRRARG